MVVYAKNIEKVKIDVDVELAEEILEELGFDSMAEVFNDEKILGYDYAYNKHWGKKMTEMLNENGRKHIKRLYDLVCAWYEENPEDAEAEGYTEW